MVSKVIKQPVKQKVRLQRRWNACTFELDGAGNIIWRLPKSLYTEAVKRKGTWVRVLYAFCGDLANALMVYIIPGQRVVILHTSEYVNDSKVGFTYNLYGAYSSYDLPEERSVLQIMYNV